MPRHALIALMTLALSAAAAPARQPRDPAVPLDPPASPEALAAFPETRNFIAEHQAFVRSRQSEGAKSDAGTRNWTSLCIAAQRLSGAWHYASESSPVYRAYVNANPEAADTADSPLLVAAAGFLEPANVDLAAEGERILADLDEMAFFEPFDDLDDTDPFTPPLAGPRPDDVFERYHLGPCRSFTRISLARMSVALNHDNPDDFLAALRGLLVTARIVDRQSDIISFGVATAMRGVALRRLLDEAARGRIGPALAESALAVLDNYPPLDLDAMLEGERLLTLYRVDWLARTGDMEALAGRSEDEDPIKVEDHRMIWLPRAELLMHTDAAFRSRAAAALGRSLPPAQAEAAAAYDRMANTFPLSVRVTPVAICTLKLDAMRRYVHSHRSSVAHYEAVRVILALERYRARHNRLPPSLDSLVPEFLSRASIDPFAPQQVPLRYKLVDPLTEREHREYLLYTVAGDGVDNAANEDTSLDHGVIPGCCNDPAPGFDYVLNRGPKKPDPKPAP